jgi:hypothetical protein
MEMDFLSNPSLTFYLREVYKGSRNRQKKMIIVKYKNNDILKACS